ncbi:hypothetical protein HN011_007166 [Eciton burchellii]|nr:hypothetical protein HN011_007166 [Eciton burchellii]
MNIITNMMATLKMLLLRNLARPQNDHSFCRQKNDSRSTNDELNDYVDMRIKIERTFLIFFSSVDIMVYLYADKNKMELQSLNNINKKIVHKL